MLHDINYRLKDLTLIPAAHPWLFGRHQVHIHLIPLNRTVVCGIEAPNLNLWNDLWVIYEMCERLCVDINDKCKQPFATGLSASAAAGEGQSGNPAINNPQSTISFSYALRCQWMSSESCGWCMDVRVYRQNVCLLVCIMLGQLAESCP